MRQESCMGQESHPPNAGHSWAHAFSWEHARATRMPKVAHPDPRMQRDEYALMRAEGCVHPGTRPTPAMRTHTGMHANPGMHAHNPRGARAQRRMHT